MRYLKIGLINPKVIVKQDINIDGTVGIVGVSLILSLTG